MSDINPRDFGRLESEVCSLHSLIQAQTIAMKAMNDRLDFISDTLSEARGGWKTLIGLSGISGTVGAALSWTVQHLQVIK